MPSGIFAEGYYHFKFRMYTYQDGKKKTFGPEYEALLIDYGSAENVMRVRFYEDNNLTIVEQKVKSEFIKEYWYFKGYNVSFIEKGMCKGYHPDDIVLKKNTENGYYYPDFVYDKKQKRYGEILSFEVLEKSGITNEFLGRFNWMWAEDVDEYNLKNTTLYLILVSATKDNDLGIASLQNHKRLYSLFSEAAEVADIGFISIEIFDDDFNKETLNKRIQAINIGSDDILIFYFSGHGFRAHKNNPWPLIKLSYKIGFDYSKNSLKLDEIFLALVDKGAGLTLVFGECCNTDAGYSVPSVPDYPQFAPGGVPLKRSALRKLFSCKGRVLVSSSSPGEYSMYYPTSGGYFCISFCRAFLETVCGLIGDEISWRNIILKAMNETTRISREDPVEASSQQPQWHVRLD